MLPRVVLGYTLAVLAFVPFLDGLSKDDYTLAIRMSTRATGRLHVYYDIGHGFREADSESTALVEGQQDYTLRLPPGRYRRLRIDPGNGPGRYALERVAIVGPESFPTRPVALPELAPISQLALIERTPERLVVDSPDGSDNPQLLYVPAENFTLVARNPAWKLIGQFLLVWTAAVALLALVGIALRRAGPRVEQSIERAAAWSHAHPRTAILAAAAIATLAATYPLVFLNRSLVTPNNGGVSMLYDQPPYTFGSRDVVLEDARGSDTGAMMWQFLPYAEIQRDAIAAREFPLWNRFNGAGRPLWGQGQTFFLDPLHWFTLLVPDLALGWDLKFTAHRFVFAAGIGFAVLGAGLSGPAAIVPAMSAPFLGYYIYRLNHSGPFSLTYAPWVLAAWFWLARAQRRSEMGRAACALAVASALLIVASSPKDAAVMLAGCCAAGCLALLLLGEGRRTWVRLGFAVMAGAVTLALTAPHWLVFADTLRRAMTTYDQPRVFFADFASAPAVLLGAVSPAIGLPSMHIVGMVLLAAALGAPRSIAQRRMLLACAMTAACLLAVGFGAVPASWLIHVPLVANIYQVHVTTISTALVLLLVASAAGVEALRTAPLLRTCIITALVGCAALWLLGYVTGVAPRDRFEIWLVGFLLAGATALPLAAFAARRATGHLLPAAGVMCLGALLLLPGGFHVETGVPDLDRVLTQPRLRMPLTQRSPAIEAIHGRASDPARVAGLGFLMFPGAQGLYTLEGIGGADALDLAPYEELVDAAGIERPMGPLAEGGWLTVVTPSTLKRLTPLLDVLNVGYLLAPGDGLSWGLADLPTRGPDRIKALQRPTAWPRAFFTDGVTVYAEPRDLLGEAAAHGGPIAAVQSTDREAIDATRGMPAAPGVVAPARAYEMTVNTTRFTVNASGPGVAVLSEAFLRDDFRSTLNGRPVPYFRVNHAFRGVAIPSAGDWTVAFEYEPVHWRLSIMIAAAGCVLLATLALATGAFRRDAGAADARRTVGDGQTVLR